MAYIKVEENGARTGKLNVDSNIDISESSFLRFIGPNLSSITFDLETLIVKEDAIVEFLSLNEFVPVDHISARTGWLQNNGNLYVNDVVLIDSKYREDETSIIKINNHADFGHLIFHYPQNTYPSSEVLISHPFEIGYENMANPAHAQLTINNTRVSFQGYTGDDDHIIYGTLNVLQSGYCKASQGATMFFKENSHINLNGGDNYYTNGAQLIAEGPSYDPGVIRLANNVFITGYKPDRDPTNPSIFGDRIITDASGRILSDDDDNHQKLSFLQVSSSHPSHAKWEGIFINTEFDPDERFQLYDSSICDIDRIYVKNSTDPEYCRNSYSNCTYGVYFDRSNNLALEQEVTVRFCSFAYNHCGVFVRDNSFSNGQQYLKATITEECTFGGDAPEDQNEYGISLSNCKEAIIDGCDFNNNMFGIFAQDSSILVGGVFGDNGIPTNEYSNIVYEPNNFYYNDHAAIWIEHTSAKSLIYNNTFTEQDEPNGRYSGMGIYSSDSEVNVMNNSFTNLRGHGFLGNLSHRTPPSMQYYFHGFSNNLFQDNGGSELIGDAASLSSIKMPYSDPNNRIIDNEDPTWDNTTDIFDFACWDHFLISSLSPFEVAEVYNNTYNPNWITSPDRFYPDVSSFLFVQEPPEPPTSLKALLTSGTEYFYLGEFNLAQETMKQIIESYPDSLETQLAIDFLYLIERATDSDFESLRNYLDLQIPLESMALYMEKEAAKAQCFLKEQDYLSAIQRLQLVIDNPETVADSLFALIDQSYCLYNYASNGAKALPNCTATTTDFPSYMQFLTELGTEEFSTGHESLSPLSPQIQRNYPNPFNPSTTIDYTLPEDGAVKLSIYNIRGQKVIELVNERRNAGNNKIIWTGKDQSGRLVSSGVYFVRIEQGGKGHVRKMMLLK